MYFIIFAIIIPVFIFYPYHSLSWNSPALYAVTASTAQPFESTIAISIIICMSINILSSHERYKSMSETIYRSTAFIMSCGQRVLSWSTIRDRCDTPTTGHR